MDTHHSTETFYNYKIYYIGKILNDFGKITNGSW